jgi:hypothetical protein
MLLGSAPQRAWRKMNFGDGSAGGLAKFVART